MNNTEFGRFNALKLKNSAAVVWQRASKPPLLKMVYWLKKKSHQPFTLLVILPWLFIAAYLVGIKTPVYESSTSILFADGQVNTTANSSFMYSILQKGKQRADGLNDGAVLLVKKYLYSQTMLDTLESALHLNDYYRARKIDWLSRLRGPQNQRVLRDHFLSKIKVVVDPYSQELVISTKAYSPIKAKEIANLVGEHAISYFKRITQSSFKEQSQQANQHLVTARTHLGDAMSALKQLQFQSKPNRAGEEELELAVKFAQTEYEAALQAYVVWQIATTQPNPVITSQSNLPDFAISPNINHDLCFYFIILTVFYLLITMLRTIIKEHID